MIFSAGTVIFFVGTVIFSVGTVIFSVGTVIFSVGTLSLNADTVRNLLSLKEKSRIEMIYFSSARIGCGQKPSTSTARVSSAMQTLLMQGRAMALSSAGAFHHMARMTLK